MTDGSRQHSRDGRRVAELRGRAAEDRCAAWLRARGWDVVGQRVRGRRGSGAGELDVIARKGEALAFIEVKARASVDHGLLAITHTQKQRLWIAAEAWLADYDGPPVAVIRFDVMVVTPDGTPHHLEDAWRLEDIQ